ncbi:capsule assembly Wzi family protein [Pedobacter immunditicola]|uniref:capsule assembly Wzi family protein n=1 Tax=Pedobacter immunditicola TaxID=3133440 RepID=UPI0030A582C0
MYNPIAHRIWNKKTIIVICVFLILFVQAKSQNPGINYEVESQALVTTNDIVPFWMRSNQYGSIPLSGTSGSFIGRAYKEYSKTSLTDSLNNKKKQFDWGFAFEGRANLGKESNLQLIEAYAKFKIRMFQLKAGRSKDLMGLNGDTVLSSGNFAVSGNALGIPKLELSIPNYYIVPIFDGLLSVKGNFAHGWLGKVKVVDQLTDINGKVLISIKNNNPISYYHQKSFYLRIGKKDYRLRLYGGFNHQVYWGNEQDTYGSNFELSTTKTFLYVITGKSYGTEKILKSKIGNQIGSIDVGAEYDFKKFKLTLYRQNFYDVGGLSKLANITDGLTGLSVENKKTHNNSKGLYWKKALIEFFYSKNQGGYPWSTPTLSGDEDYYNNYYYQEGWSYKDNGIGNPLITQNKYAKEGQAIYPYDNFLNNRVAALHLGLEGGLNDWKFITKLTYSRNFGSFATSIYGKSSGSTIIPPDFSNIFTPVYQGSFYFEGMKTLQNGFHTSLAISLDNGKLLKNSLGSVLKLKKTF